MTPILNGVLISDIDENTTDNGKHVALFHLSKYSDKLYGNIVYKIKIERSNFIQGPVSLVFAAISEFPFSGFSRFTIYKLIIVVTAKLKAFLTKIITKNLHEIISKLLAFIYNK